MKEPAIGVHALLKSYGAKVAVDRVSFEIPRGCVCGLVGPNGAGKTTCIRMLLGLVLPSGGHARVLGLDPFGHGFALKQRIGYVPEHPTLFGFMRVREMLDWVAHLYPTWDHAHCQRVVDILGVPLERRVSALSRGERAKVALTMAVSHHPELLILDEPTSGLDPLIRRDFLRAIVDVIQTEERTVFFSSHILSDIEQVADRVVVLRGGRVVADDRLEALCARYARVSFIFDEAPAELGDIPGALSVDRGLREWVALLPSVPDEDLQDLSREIGARDWLRQAMSFEEVFVQIVERGED